VSLVQISGIAIASNAAALLWGPRRFLWLAWASTYFVSSALLLALADSGHYMQAWEVFALVDLALKFSVALEERPRAHGIVAVFVAAAVIVILQDRLHWPGIRYEYLLAFCAWGNLTLALWIWRTSVLAGYLALNAVVLLAVPIYPAGSAYAAAILDFLAFSCWIVV
jgi:hypothetical protein